MAEANGVATCGSRTGAFLFVCLGSFRVQRGARARASSLFLFLSYPPSLTRRLVLHTSRTNENVRMFWIDYDGNHQPYKLLSPGQKHRQQTYLTHPWTFMTVFESEEEEEHLDGNGASDDVEERDVPMRMVIHDSPVFYPPPETVDLEEEFDMEEGDMAPSYAGRANAEVFSITYPKTVTNWSPKSNNTLECYQSEAFQSAVRETLRVWMFAHAKQEEEEEEQQQQQRQQQQQQQQQQRKETREETAGPEPCQSDSNIITRANHTKTTLSDIPKDVLINEIIRRFAPEPPYYNLMLCT